MLKDIPVHGVLVWGVGELEKWPIKTGLRLAVARQQAGIPLLILGKKQNQ